ncbi:MAG: methyl-accepting chemotaxis protein [Planctomycetota bacterium]
MSRTDEPDLASIVESEVRHVLTDSEEATLTLGKNLSEIVSLAEQFVDQLQRSVGSIGSSGEGSISHSLELQADSTEKFVDDLGRVIADNSAIADRVLEATGAVSSAAESVADVASQARMLCFNTKIEAGRLGDLGRPFMVIADQMRELSEAIAASNERISELSADLTPLLGEVKTSVHALQGRKEEFTAQNDEHRMSIQSKSRELQDATAETIATGDDKLAEIISRSGESLVALQTQDLIAQRLRRILAAANPECTSEDPDLGTIGYLSDDLQPDGDSMGAGEMELF